MNSAHSDTSEQLSVGLAYAKQAFDDNNQVTQPFAQLVRRSGIVLLAADGWPNQDIAQALSVSRPTVGKWHNLPDR